MYVKLENGVPVVWPIGEYEIRAEYPDVSLPEYLTADVVEPLNYGIFIVNGYPADYDPQWENIEEVPPVYVDGVYQQTYVITQKYTPAEKQAIEDEQSKQRNKSTAESLLQQTDWTATVDINNPQYSNPHLGNQSEFLAYRSQLRQIAVNPPVTVETWPTIPNEVWVTV